MFPFLSVKVWICFQFSKPSWVTRGSTTWTLGTQKKLSVTLSLKKPLWKSRDGWVGIFKKVLENLPAFKPAVLVPKFSFKAQMYIFNHCCWEAFHNIVFGGVTGMKLSWAVDVPRELSSPSFSQLSKGLSLFDGQLPSKTPFLRADALGAKLC